MVTGNLHDFVRCRFHDKERSLFIHEHVTHFKRRNVTEGVFIRNTVNGKFRRCLHALGVGEHHLFGTYKERMRGLRFGQKQFRDFHESSRTEKRPFFMQKGCI